MVIDRLADREEYPNARDPQNLLQFTSGSEHLEEGRGFKIIRVAIVHDDGYDSNMDAKVG